jgi:hypothetical protein
MRAVTLMDRTDIASALGELYRNLPTTNITRTGVHDPPPVGAAKLVGRSTKFFKWEPISKAQWKKLSDLERGEILLQRGEAWLDENASIKASPLAYLSVRPANVASRRMFGKPIATLRDGILFTYKLMHQNPLKAKGAVLTLEVTILVITGLHPLAFAPPAIDLLVEAYGSYLSRR